MFPHYKSKKGMLDMKIAFWRGKASVNPKVEEVANKEILKLQIELRKLNTKV